MAVKRMKKPFDLAPDPGPGHLFRREVIYMLSSVCFSVRPPPGVTVETCLFQLRAGKKKKKTAGV